MNMIPFRAEHAALIDLQAEQERIEGIGHVLEAASNPAWTLQIADKIIACCGVAAQWDGRYTAWTLISRDAGPHMIRLTRMMNRMIELFPGPWRMEAYVKTGFEAGDRLMKAMGFRFETRAEKFMPDRSDANIYVRFKEAA